MKMLLYKTCLVVIFIGCCCCKAVAQDNIDSLKKVLLTEKEDTNKVHTLYHICGYYIDANDYENTMQNAKAMLALSTKINYKRGIADGYFTIGFASRFKKDYDNEDKYFNKVLNLYKEMKDTPNIILYYYYMTDAYSQDNEASKALASVYAAQKIIEQTGNKKNIADGFLKIGITLSNTIGDNSQEELKYAFAALKLYKEINDKKGAGVAILLIGIAYADQHRYAEALNKYKEALQMLKDSGSLYRLADTYEYRLADTYDAMGYAYEWEGDSAYNKGNKTLAQDKYLKAEKNDLIGLRRWQALQALHSVQAAECYSRLGYINIKLKKLSTAKKYLDSSFIIFQSFGSGPHGQTDDIYRYYAQIDSIQGNYKDAYKNYKLYKIYYDSANNEEDAKKAVQVQMQYEFDKKDAAAKAAQDRKDADAKRIKNQQLFIILALGIVVLAVVIIALIQFKNNKQKQKVNLLLEKQKQKVETTLTELKSTQTQLIQSEKMASLGELTAGIAHEIQNPLNFVNNFSEVNKELIEELRMKNEKLKIEDNEVNDLLSDLADNEEKINHHGKRADAIVKGMLQHSRQTSGAKEPTDINALCDEYLRLSYHGLRAKDKNFNVDFKTDFDNSIGKINIVPQDIGRVLLNLFNNAFYAVSKPPSLKVEEYKPLVTVTTRKIKPENNNAAKNTPLGDGGVEVIVSDNGNGIPQNIIDKIFQPFFTTKPTGQGTGLGLSLAYDIITKEHNGTIKVESNEGEGSEFIIQLQIS